MSSPLILGSFDPMIDAGVFSRCVDICGDSLGGLVTKSTTINPRSGYPDPKVARLGQGLLIASGNPNPGISGMASEVRKFKQRFPDFVVIGSIINDPDHPRDDLAEEYSLLAVEYARSGVDGLELNLSCPHLDPNEKELTIVPAQDERLVYRLVNEIKSSLKGAGFGNSLVIPKLTGWNCNLSEVAKSAEMAGADAITVSNLFPGTGYYTGLTDPGNGAWKYHGIGDHLVAHGKGGYSGKSMHAAVLLMIESLRKHVRIPIIASGGCASDLDSLVQTFMAGATAVQSVTPFYFRDLNEMETLIKVKDLVTGLENYLEQHDLERPQDLYRLRTQSGIE